MASEFDAFEQKRSKKIVSSTFSDLEQSIGKTGRSPSEPKKTLGGFVGNLFSSSGKAIEGIGSALADPVGTIGGIGKVIAGGIQSIPAVGKLYGEDEKMKENQQVFQALVKMPGERYGSVDKALNTLYYDPAGVALDAATVLSGGGAAATKLGAVSKLGKIAEAGKALSVAGEAINPISQGLKYGGKGLSALTKGKTIGGSKFTSDVIPSAENIGIPKEQLPISTMTKSPVSAGAEAWAAKGIGGGKILDQIENVYNKMNEKVTNLLAKSPSAVSLGNNLSRAVDDFKKNYLETKQKLYDEASIPLTKNGESSLFKGTDPTQAIDSLSKKIAAGEKQGIAAGVLPANLDKTFPELAGWKKELQGLQGALMTAELPKTKSLLSSLISTEKEALKALGRPSSPDLKNYESMLKGLSRKDITTSGVNESLKIIEKDLTASPLVQTGDKAVLARIQQTMNDEFLAILKKQRPDLAVNLTKADEFYKQGIQKINSGVIQAIKENVRTPDVIVKELLPKIESVEDIKTLIQVVGEENMVGVRQSLLSDIFKKAKSAGSENFQPAGLSRQIKGWGEDKLQLLLKPEQYQTLKDLEKVSLSLKTGQSWMSGSPTAFIQRSGRTGSLFGLAMVSLVSGNIAGFASIMSTALGEIGFNSFVASPFGKKLLTEGITFSGKTGRTIQQIAPSAGKAALFGQQNKNYQESLNSLFNK